MHKKASASYLFGWAWCGVQINNVTINHLFTRMFEINCYIHPNDRLNLTNAPIGPVWMDHKITEAEVKQMQLPYGFSNEKQSKKYYFVAMIGWSLASPFDAKNHKLGHLRVEAAWEGKSRFERPII